ncbi:MAG TPA: hypothetical protein VMT34_14600 [Aggregatilineales bacterium]|nr:hypothetical protein [Aggregatilineales bacterium]
MAVYCNPSSVDVWAIDSDAVGFYATTFGLAELQSKQTVAHTLSARNGTSLGTITLSFDSPAQYTSGFTDYTATTWETVVSVGAMYHVTWTGAYGADGSAPFVKHFSCTY